MKFYIVKHFSLLLLLIIGCGQKDTPEITKPANPSPPYSGTIFIDPDIITAADPNTFEAIEYTGQGSRTLFDRRVNDWVTVDAFLFQVTFNDGLTTEVQVNPEFETEVLASLAATKYAEAIGQLPKILRTDVDAVWIHQGTEPFGGGNNSILIHTGQALIYQNDGILEETLVHEAAHTSLDAVHASSSGWLASQQADGNFISTYARDNPGREDIAESFLLYLAVRFKAKRISETDLNTILTTIPNRISYFDNQSFDLHPWQ